MTSQTTDLPPGSEGRPAPPTYRELLARLGTSGKSNRGAAGYTRWVNRRLGRHLAAIAFRLGRTPNQLTVLSAVLTGTALALIALVRPSWGIAVAITVLLLVGYAFDSGDGLLARLRGGGSPAGEYLDHCVDAVKTSTVHLVVLICWYRFYDLSEPALLLIPIAFAAVHPVYFFALMLSDSIKARRTAAAPPAAATATASNEPAPVLPSLLVLPNDWGVMCLCMLLLPATTAFEVVYGTLLVANTLFLAVGLTRWYRRLLPDRSVATSSR